MVCSSAVLTAASAAGWALSHAPVELATWPRAEDSPEAVQPGWAVAMGMLEAMAVRVLIMVPSSSSLSQSRDVASDRFLTYGGPDWRKSFVIDERDQLTAYNDE